MSEEKVKFVTRYSGDLFEQKVARDIVKIIQKEVDEFGCPYGEWDTGFSRGLESAIREIKRKYQIED